MAFLPRSVRNICQYRGDLVAVTVEAEVERDRIHDVAEVSQMGEQPDRAVYFDSRLLQHCLEPIDPE